MAETAQTGLIRATQVAREAEVRRSANGVRFATFGDTGVTVPDLDSMIEAVPPAISAALKANTYFFVPLALREAEAAGTATSLTPSLIAKSSESTPDHAFVASEYSSELDARAICHRNVSLGSGQQGVFISTSLMGDRFALCFEFFINVAHAFVDEAGVPERFAELVWQQALSGVRGETSMDAWESRNLALGLPPEGAAQPQESRAHPQRRGRTFALAAPTNTAGVVSSVASSQIDEKERGSFVSAAFSDAVAVYLLSLALDFDYSELREREYPLLAPAALAARLRLVGELFPPTKGYEFSVRYRRRA